MIRRCFCLSGLFLLLVLCSGCGVIDYFFLSPPEDTAQELAELGNEAMQEKEYGKAIEYFQKLRDRYPFSPFTTAGELSLGDAYFLDEQYRAASETYKEFESLHPRHEAIPYVLLQIGISSYNQFESIDLPQDNIARHWSTSGGSRRNIREPSFLPRPIPTFSSANDILPSTKYSWPIFIGAVNGMNRHGCDMSMLSSTFLIFRISLSMLGPGPGNPMSNTRRPGPLVFGKRNREAGDNGLTGCNGMLRVERDTEGLEKIYGHIPAKPAAACFRDCRVQG